MKQEALQHNEDPNGTLTEPGIQYDWAFSARGARSCTDGIALAQRDIIHFIAPSEAAKRPYAQLVQAAEPLLKV